MSQIHYMLGNQTIQFTKSYLRIEYRIFTQDICSAISLNCFDYDTAMSSDGGQL